MRSSDDERTASLRPGARSPAPRPVEGPGGAAARPDFPEVGDRFADCLLLAELGRGTEGRVFLASQADLGDRLIVLKVTPSGGGEHLALARLVHTHIAPLLFAREMPDVGLRILAMPFVGGTSLLQVRDRLRERSAPFSGRNVVEILAHSGPGRAIPAGSDRLLERLAALDAPTFVAWLGACLADALGHAHERGLVHLDVKPGNVLLAADGTPLLLDFHLAQEQIAAGAASPESFGGTEGYAAPEQRRAGEAFHRKERSPVAVDGRADLHALGVTLFELLAGVRPDEAGAGGHLRRAGASAGLAAILAKCTNADPAGRYAGAAMLADDLRRHLTHRPLRGVPNRSLGERWRKWRRRNPGAVRRVGAWTLLAATLLLGIVAVVRSHWEKRRVVAEAVQESRRLRELGRPGDAVFLLSTMRGQSEWPAMAARLDAEKAAARRERDEQEARHRRAGLAADLDRLARDLRLRWDHARLTADQAARLKRQCARLWDRRQEMAVGLGENERHQLIEVALVLSTLEKSPARLDEAETTLGKAEAISAERARLRGGVAPADRGAARATAWENYWAGRVLMRAGRFDEAIARFAAAEAAEPDAVWPCFYRGVCASRLGRHGEAEGAFRVCEALLPRSAEVRLDRASALVALGRTAEARDCLDGAVALRPGLGEAWFHRGVLNAREGKRAEAIADLERALTTGASPGATHFNLAVVHHESGHQEETREHLRLALEADPADAEALRFRRKIETTGRKR